MLKLADLLVGDHQKVPGAAGWVEHLDRTDPVEELSELSGIIGGCVVCPVEVVQEQGTKHLHDVLDRCVMHPKARPLLGMHDRLDHRSEDVRVDLRPVEFSTFKNNRTSLRREARDSATS